MHSVTSFFQSRFPSLLVVVALLFLAACKIEIKNEIWLNKNTSGKSIISACVKYDKLDDTEDGSAALDKQPLEDYINLIESTNGAKLISKKTIDNSTDDEVIVNYLVEFKFDNIETLNKILAVENGEAFSFIKAKKGGTFRLYPQMMSLIDEGFIGENITDTSMFDIKFSMILHTPNKIKETDAMVETRIDEYTAEWDFTINDDWYESPVDLITVEY